jgi:hypothetical protein
MLDPLPLRGEQLDKSLLIYDLRCGLLVLGLLVLGLFVLRGCGRGAGFDGHVPLLSGPVTGITSAGQTA